jgi:host factor-I protein
LQPNAFTSSHNIQHLEGAFIVNRKLFRPTLTEVKEQQYAPRPATPMPQQVPARKKPAPPEQTHAENFYFVKQMQARTPVAVVLNDGEVLRGTVEWYDRDCIKLTRFGSPNLLIYKHCIKYVFKEGEDAAQGGTNGQ